MGWREPEVSDATAESVWGMQMIRQLMERAVGAFVGRFTVVRRVSDSIHHELGYLPERKMRRLVKQVRRLEEKNYRIKRRCDKEYDRLATLLLKILRKNVGRKIPLAIIIDLKSQGVITDKAIFKYTGYLFDTRRFHEVEEILATSTVTCSIIVDYYRCLLEIYHGDVGFQCRKLKSKSKIGIPEFMKEPIDNLLLEISVREQRTDLVSRALENAYEQRVTQLPPELMLGICRLLIGTDQQHVAKASLDKYQRGKPYEELFYFLEPLRALSSPRVDTMNTWRSVLERLVQTYSAQDSASAAYFKETIAAQLQLVPIGDRDLLDIRFSQSERDQLRALVSRKLAHREPISLVRIGDGSAYAFLPEGTETGPDIRSGMERVWWGEGVEVTTRADIIARVQASVRAADILGIPSVYRLIRDRTLFGGPFGALPSHMALIAVLGALGNLIPLEGKVFTEERCNYVAFSKRTLEEIAQTASKVVIVSCWTSSDFVFQASCPVEFITIPPDQKTARTVGPSRSKPLWLSYPQVSERVRDTCRPGHLALVGAGILGKVFVHEARQAGAVALDVGSMPDYFAGYKTRCISDLI